MTALGTPGYKALRYEYNLVFDDAWGDTIEWWFAIAETLYHRYGNTELPREWKFRDSPIHSDEWPEDDNFDYVIQTIHDLIKNDAVDYDDLLTFGNVLFRYARILEAAGKDY
jgi:hypothetical protein